ncbi:MAG: hypothetical protein M1825_003460 [Sarcosagium campestre]|nr:MAG: hypothetical protein M1825_003460 [Sarcosagium campestre]
MSLFGDSHAGSTLGIPDSKSGGSLFDDSTPAATLPQSSIFADDVGAGGNSPWDMPTPKKAARRDLVDALLPATDVPESYVDAFDTILNAEEGPRKGSSLAVADVRKLVLKSGLSSGDQARILDIVLSGRQASPADVSRGAFNVLLALIGLAQEGEDITLDGVDERRKSLPEPKLTFLGASKRRESSDAAKVSKTDFTARKPDNDASSANKSRDKSQSSMELPEEDPWASPALHKGHNHPENGGLSKRSNGNSFHRPAPTSHSASGRTTSAFTTASAEPPLESSSSLPSQGNATGGDGEGWASYGGSEGGSGIGGEGFGSPGGGDGGRGGSGDLRRSLGGGRVTGTGVEEVIAITVLPEKEGMFLFQHRNYQVSSERRGSKVIRRYSDFVWLLDCLHKRYPFRQLPLLPPKRVAVNGTHLSSDNSFIEKRRRGLTRFCNALVRHPVLKQEQLVVMFLTVPTELSVWRKQSQISVQEEFEGKPLPPDLEDSFPRNLHETFDTVRDGVRRSSEIYINLCTLLERLAKRNEGIAADYLRLSHSLQAVADASESTYAVDTSDVALLNAGITATARHVSLSQGLLEDEAKAWDHGVLEDLKRQRDVLVSVRDLFDRRDRYAGDTIPALEKRIESNEAKLRGLKNRPDGTVKPEEIEKLETLIIKDKESIVAQHARGVFITECIRDELNFFQQSQYHVSRLHQDWSQERVKYAELQADTWRSLSDEVERMPQEE